MTSYYGLVFIVLILEMSSFSSLVAPLPASVHAKSIQALRTPFMTTVIRSLKFLFFFILILFVDSVQRVHRVPELETGAQLTVADRSDYQARKFYNQRNMYLCGFTSFLSLISNRTYTSVKSNSDSRLQLGQNPSNNKADVSSQAQDYKERLERKKKQYKELEARNEELQKDYYKVCDESKVLQGKQRNIKQD